MHGTNQFIQQLGPLAFEGQFDLTAYLKMFLDEYSNENQKIGSFSNQNTAGTSNLTETMLQYTYIEPDTFKTGGLVEVLVRATNADFFGDAQVYIYANTSPTLVGATLIGSTTLSASTPVVYAQIVRTLYVEDAALRTNVFNPAIDSITEYQSVLIPVGVAIDWTTDQYIITSGFVTNASDILASELTFIKYFNL